MKSIQDIEKVENLLSIGNYETLYRLNYGGQRLYVREEPFKYYSGLTSALSASTFNGSPENKRLKKWRESFIDQHGKGVADSWLDMTADFGTLLHTSIVTIKEKGKIDWSYEEDHAFEYFVDAYRKQNLTPNAGVIKSMVFEYMKHVGSLMQFVYERVHEIYAVEVPVRWEELNIATPVDLYCSCRQTPKGDFKNTTINIKTSSQIGKHQLEQIACEFMMWNETYGGAENTAIIRTKDWKVNTGPTYEYKSLTVDDVFRLIGFIQPRLELCLNSEASYYPNPVTTRFKGVTKIGEQPEVVLSSLEEEWQEAK